MSLSLVSVVIPTHNRKDILIRAINSLNAQTYPNIEIIVINDASSDGTADCIRELNQPNILYIENTSSLGACASRNKGIFAANGKFVTFLDDDDQYLPHRLEMLVNAYDDAYAYSACGFDIIKPNLKKHPVVFNKPIVKLQDVLFQQVVGTMFLTTKEKLVAVGGFDESLPSSQDYDMVIRMNLNYGEGKYLQQPLALVHADHNYGRITTSPKKARGHWLVYKKHKHLFNDMQRRFKLFELLVYKKKKITFKHVLCLTPRFYWHKSFKTYVSLKLRSMRGG